MSTIPISYQLTQKLYLWAKNITLNSKILHMESKKILTIKCFQEDRIIKKIHLTLWYKVSTDPIKNIIDKISYPDQQVLKKPKVFRLI